MPTDRERTRAFNKERRNQLKAGLVIRKDTYGEIRRLLAQAQTRIQVILAGQPSDYQQWILPQLTREIRAALSAVERQAGNLAEQAASRSWEAGIDLVDRPLAAGGVVVAGVLPQISLDQLTAMREFMVDRIKDVPLALANRIASELGLTVIGAQGVGDTVRNIQRLFGTQGRQRALTIVRTELGRVYAVASHRRMAQAGELLPGLKKQWRRSGKVHSRVNHDAIDGQVRDVDEWFSLSGQRGMVRLMHPRDPRAPAGETINCGCESLPYMADWEMSISDRLG